MTDLLRRYVRPQTPRVVLLAVLVVAGVGLRLSNPLLLRAFLDGTVAGASDDALVLIAVAFLAVVLAAQVVAVAETWVGEDVGWRATNRLRLDLAGHCLRLDPGFHDRHRPGELIERIDGDVGVLSELFSRLVIRVLANLLLVAGILFVLTTIDPSAGAAFAAYVAAGLALFHRLGDAAAPHWRALQGANAELYGFLEERLAGTEDLRSRGAVGHVLGRLRPLLGAQRDAEVSAQRMTVLTLFAAVVMLQAVGAALAYGLGGALYQAGTVTIGTVYLLVGYAWLVAGPLNAISEQLQGLQRARASAARVRELLATPGALSAGGTTPLPAGPLALELDDVRFAYAAGVPVLEGVSVTLAAGRVLALVGRTGSGKSTIARLVARLYDPDAGSVRLGGVDAREARPDDLRARVGFVTQDVQLFRATVRQNVTLFDPSVPDERILDALRWLGLWRWYAALPTGLETGIAPDGLSAGEAQLLAFVRVFLRDPGLVILDEASARLDPATERLTDGAVRALLRGRTAVVIAHRPATVRRADELLVLEDGRVRERGERASLERDPGWRYAALRRADPGAVPA